MADAESGDMEAPDSADRHALNTKFLGRFLQGVEQGNKRVIATNAAKAAQQHLAAAGAASLRPSLHKAASRGIDAVAKVALASAEQQKLVLCTALLKEVATVFGYRLRLTRDGQPVLGADDDAPSDSFPLQDLPADLGDAPEETPGAAPNAAAGARGRRARTAAPKVRLDFGISQRALSAIGVGAKRARPAGGGVALTTTRSHPQQPLPAKRARGAAGARAAAPEAGWEQVPQSDSEGAEYDGAAEEEAYVDEAEEVAEGEEQEQEVYADSAAGDTPSPQGGDEAVEAEGDCVSVGGEEEEEEEENDLPSPGLDDEGTETEPEEGGEAPCDAAATHRADAGGGRAGPRDSVFARLGGGGAAANGGGPRAGQTPAAQAKRPAVAAAPVAEAQPNRSRAQPAAPVAGAARRVATGGVTPPSGPADRRPAPLTKVRAPPGAAGASSTRPAPAAAAIGSSEPAAPNRNKPAAAPAAGGGASVLSRSMMHRLGASAAGEEGPADRDGGAAAAGTSRQAAGSRRPSSGGGASAAAAAAAAAAAGRRGAPSVFGAVLNGLRRVRSGSDGE